MPTRSFLHKLGDGSIHTYKQELSIWHRTHRASNGCAIFRETISKWPMLIWNRTIEKQEKIWTDTEEQEKN